MYSPKTFCVEIERRLKDSEKNFDWFIDGYLWAQRNIKRIHKHWPEYTNERLRSDVRRVYSVDPQAYVRTARRLGGNGGGAGFGRGRAFLKRFGVYECFRAERLLDADGLKKIGEMVADDWDADRFSQEVTKIDLDSRRGVRPRPGGGLRLKERIALLEIENDKLRSENASLRTENGILRGKLEVLDQMAETISKIRA